MTFIKDLLSILFIEYAWYRRLVGGTWERKVMNEGTSGEYDLWIRKN